MTDSVKITTSNTHSNMDSGDLLLASNNNLKLIPKMNECDCNMNMSNSVENTQNNNMDNKKITHLFNIVPEIKPAPPEHKFMYRRNNCWNLVNMGDRTFNECLYIYHQNEAGLLAEWGFDVDEWICFKIVYSYCGCNEIIAKGKLKLYNDTAGKIQVKYVYK